MIISRLNFSFRRQASEKAVCKPIIPNSALSKATFLCSISSGVWSVHIASIVPSFNPSIKAEISSCVRNAGLTLNRGLKSSQAVSSNIKLCIATSAVTATPFCFAFLMSATLLADDIHERCNFPPVYSASLISLSIISSFSQ